MELGLVTRSEFPIPLVPMPAPGTSLGECPACQSALRPGAVLIEYTVDEETRRYVECEECNAPVRPA